ncbi:MAG: response regulator [Lentisphaerae bacterium]|nr:response regulator [Lentisphaerota bacterium]
MNEFIGHKALLADDSEQSREEIASIMREFGMECDVVGNGEEMLERLNASGQGEYSFVLADVTLPYKTGLEACAEFRSSEHPDAKTLPIFGIAASEDDVLFDRAVAAGFNGMTQKPVSKELLFARLTLVLNGSQSSRKFARSVRSAIEAAKSKNFFFSAVSHDIRTPLNAIIGFSQLLKIGFPTKEEADKAIDSILVSGKTLLQLINDVLDLSKLEAGKMTIEPEPTDCCRLVDEIIVSFRAANTKKGLDIRAKAGPMPKLMIDPQRLRQIVFNLVGNAVKFTEKGYVEVRLEFDEYADGESGTLRLEVDDTGCGISEEDQRRLASPYVQVGSSRAKRLGTGLGLSICRQLTIAMNGQLELQSALGCGTTFFVTLPNMKICDPLAHAKKSATQRIAVNLDIGADLSDRRVLIVDDARMNRIVLTTMLSRLGFSDIVSAENGVEALDIIAEEHPKKPFSYIFTDMWMPELDGEGLIKEIRKIPELADLPVYAVTADIEVQKDYGELGFTGVLLKPITFETIKNALGII